MLDIEKLMREGKTLDEIGKMVTAEMDAVQKKIDEENAKKTAAAQKQEQIAKARRVAVAALGDYFTLVMPKATEKCDIYEIVEEALDTLEDTIKSFESIKITYNGQPFDIFKL